MCYKHNDDDVDYDYDVVLLFEKMKRFDFFNLSAGCSFTCQYMIGTHDNDEDTYRRSIKISTHPKLFDKIPV